MGRTLISITIDNIRPQSNCPIHLALKCLPFQCDSFSTLVALFPQSIVSVHSLIISLSHGFSLLNRQSQKWTCPRTLHVPLVAVNPPSHSVAYLLSDQHLLVVTDSSRMFIVTISGHISISYDTRLEDPSPVVRP